ncbi:MAG: TetR/AcrR family transcriptional regulator [Chloroflexi bacterium]|nr:TetR/AcrR family transcriptional regulator [Chloroflexota bacterium]
MKSTDNLNAERILQDGWELFQQKGYRGVSVDEICLRCGITKPTLYYYFKDKENLFVEVLLRRLRGFHEIIEQSGPLEQRLERIVLSMLDSFPSSYTHLVHDLEHIKQRENADRVRKAFADELFSPITALMQSAIEAGEIGGDAKFLSQLFMGIVENYISRAHELGGDNKLLAQKLVAFFLKGAR